MDRGEQQTATVGGRPLIASLGALYIVLAVGWSVGQLNVGKPASNVTLVAAFIGVPGLVLLYGGYRLPRTDIRPRFYPVVARWCLGGLLLLLGMLALYQLEPAKGVNDPSQAALVLSAFGIAAGFGVGVYDALAKTQALEVQRRNRELQEVKRRLEATNEELEASNERLEQFAYAASHDLQEPLRMITSYLSLVERRYGDDLDDDGEEFIEYAVDGAERMREMIDGLLEYSRVETQGDPFEPVDLESVFADVRRDLELQLAEHDATVEIGPLPRVKGDGHQLRQLFQNLLSNAVEYSDEPPRIRVTAERNGSRWTVSVADDGIGIDPDDQERIFRVFQRLHGRDEYDGTGLGLALCQRIVERHDGDIWVDSEPGKGSTFSVTLPAVADRDE
ncbi:integral membrane sensor signal transduction histidine kinase [Haloterrigena salina JCM 13891]|uniref:histidine kinase n=1 Tax=Haloterrigena salina JCM 13891 TaxID=1227488 RepID=M0CCK4_9EURY|nr:ATP-binding protein [Haloterrigena salina]ELZ19624.1 integral membrane sensor signal transduction histidine kinase [Haloterrigena salina JCM 13891]